ncbi:PTH4 protein, partial [Ptilonorhynchus violaceus]|nr:PTH4 protein [Ptilonorhynchus violaceus]
MFLPQRSLLTVTFWAIVFFVCLATCQDIENRRAGTENQLLHHKGRAFQGLKRLMRLHHVLGTVRTASGREIPLPNAGWDARESQDPSDLSNGIHRDQASSLMEQ